MLSDTLSRSGAQGSSASSPNTGVPSAPGGGSGRGRERVRLGVWTSRADTVTVWGSVPLSMGSGGQRRSPAPGLCQGPGHPHVPRACSRAVSVRPLPPEWLVPPQRARPARDLTGASARPGGPHAVAAQRLPTAVCALRETASCRDWVTVREIARGPRPWKISSSPSRESRFPPFRVPPSSSLSVYSPIMKDGVFSPDADSVVLEDEPGCPFFPAGLPTLVWPGSRGTARH